MGTLYQQVLASNRTRSGKENVEMWNVSHILTSIQQLFHNVEVGMGYTVMEGSVSIAIGHIYNVL